MSALWCTVLAAASLPPLPPFLWQKRATSRAAAWAVGREGWQRLEGRRGTRAWAIRGAGISEIAWGCA